MDVSGDVAAVDGLEASGPGHGDVLTELAGERRALLLEPRDRTDSLGLDELERLLAESLELHALRDRLCLAADGDHRPARVVVCQAVADEPLRRGAIGALRRV